MSSEKERLRLQEVGNSTSSSNKSLDAVRNATGSSLYPVSGPMARLAEMSEHILSPEQSASDFNSQLRWGARQRQTDYFVSLEEYKRSGQTDDRLQEVSQGPENHSDNIQVDAPSSSCKDTSSDKEQYKQKDHSQDFNDIMQKNQAFLDNINKKDIHALKEASQNRIGSHHTPEVTETYNKIVILCSRVMIARDFFDSHTMHTMHVKYGKPTREDAARDALALRNLLKNPIIRDYKPIKSFCTQMDIWYQKAGLS